MTTFYAEIKYYICTIFIHLPPLPPYLLLAAFHLPKACYVLKIIMSLPDTKLTENIIQQIFVRYITGDLGNILKASAQVRCKEIAGDAVV